MNQKGFYWKYPTIMQSPGPDNHKKPRKKLTPYKYKENLKEVYKYYTSKYGKEPTKEKKLFSLFKVMGKTMAQSLDKYVKKHPEFLDTSKIKIIKNEEHKK